MMVDREIGSLSCNHAQVIRSSAVSIPSQNDAITSEDQEYGESVIMVNDLLSEAHHTCKCK